jgi:hypothetical protein
MSDVTIYSYAIHWYEFHCTSIPIIKGYQNLNWGKYWSQLIAINNYFEENNLTTLPFLKAHTEHLITLAMHNEM